MAELLMMLGLGVVLSVSINKAMTFLLRRLGFGLHGPSKKEEQALPSKKAPWRDLPPELLGLVLLRMPTHADRVRLCAVCRQWRSAARLQPLPPLLPWLALRDDNFLSLPDGAVHRIPLPGDISYRISTGRLLFLVHRDGSCCLMNPFPRETTPQQIDPDALDLNLDFYGSSRICKVVVTDHIVAVLTRGKMDNKNVNIFTRGSPQGAGSCPTMEWAPPGECYVADIALFQGRLYVLTAKHDQDRQPPELHVLDVSNEQTGIKSIQCIRSTARGHYSTPSYRAECLFLYLVACGDRLLMVERKIDLDPINFTPTGIHIEILEAMDLSSGGSGGGGWWSKVDTLMGHALSVSMGCSESLLACGGGTGAREDCVYFTTERITGLFSERKPEDYLLGCIVYNMRDRTVVQLPLETEAALSGTGPWQPAWVFPAVI